LNLKCNLLVSSLCFFNKINVCRYASVEKNLPPKKEMILKVGMSEVQKEFYKKALQKDIEVGGCTS
jgi:hypothetical protein